MKLEILAIAMIIASIFAGSFVFAKIESESNLKISLDQAKSKEPVETTEVPSTIVTYTISDDSKEDTQDSILEDDSVPIVKANVIEKEAKEKTIEKVKNFDDRKKVGFQQNWQGNGWITNTDSGYQISVFWSIQKFADENQDFEDIGTGKLKIAGLESLELDLEERTDRTLRFLVNKGKDKIGTMFLEIKEDYKDVTLWTGDLTLDFEKLSGVWKIELGTNSYTLNPASSREIPSIKQKPKEKACTSILGDANNDGRVDISDPIFISLHLRGEANLRCSENADVNLDNKIDQADVDYLLNYLFIGGNPPGENQGDNLDATCETAVKGDANLDGNVDVADVVFINLYRAGEVELKCELSTDVNSDGVIDQEDVEFILDYLFNEDESQQDKIVLKKAEAKGQNKGFFAKIIDNFKAIFQ